jgi:RNA polymerase sigma factor (TIGR02999 family)
MSDVTQVLSQIESGDPNAAERLLPLVYDELRKLAAAKLAQEKPGQTLQSTALVHEAFIRLVDTDQAQQWKSRGHFFAAAAEAMRRILVENARRKNRVKRGGEWTRQEWNDLSIAAPEIHEDLIALDAALVRLKSVDPQAVELARKPYDNVWLSIVPILIRLNLDLDSALIQLPLPLLCIRLPIIQQDERVVCLSLADTINCWIENLLGRTTDRDDGRVFEWLEAARGKWWSTNLGLGAKQLPHLNPSPSGRGQGEGSQVREVVSHQVLRCWAGSTARTFHGVRWSSWQPVFFPTTPLFGRRP